MSHDPKSPSVSSVPAAVENREASGGVGSSDSSASERVKYWEDRFHAALRPDGLRAIAEGIAHPNSTFTISGVQECLRVAADKIEALEQSSPNTKLRGAQSPEA